MITVAALVASGIAPTQAREFERDLAYACERFRIGSALRQAAFLAQVAHESGNFTHLEENLYYSTPERIRAVWPTRVPSLGEAAKLIRNPEALANRVYANRNGNGDEASGDGWKYRGRGLIQLTGRANYLAADTAIGQPYKTQPQLVAEPANACLTAAWFWAAAGCNELADASNIDAITRAINGPAMLDAHSRRQRFDEALSALQRHA